MAKVTHITGVTAIVKKMDIFDKKTEMGLARGLKRGGTRLQRESQLVVPVDTTNLKGSAFTRNMGGQGKDTDIWVGYTAAYAIYVHEMIDNAHGAGKQAKYLEEPARIHRDAILKLIAESIY